MINFFKRRAGFVFAPQTTHARMEARHDIRPVFGDPMNYGELMYLHREVGQMSSLGSTEYLIHRNNAIRALERSTKRMFMRNEINHIVRDKIMENVSVWNEGLRLPVPVPVKQPWWKSFFRFPVASFNV